MEVQVERQPAFLLLRVKGDMRFWGHQEREDNLRDSLRSGLENPTGQLVLSLAGVTHIDTTGIAALVRVIHECAKHHVSLKVVMPPGLPGEALRRVRIFDAWPTFREEAAALNAAGG